MVTVVLTVSNERDLAAVRQLFPDAEERLEVVGQRPEGGTCVDVSEPVFRAKSATIQDARVACQLLPQTVRRRFEGPMLLDERELQALARHHAYRLLDIEHLINVDQCFGSSDLRRRDYHDARLSDLDGVLGRVEVDVIFDEVKRTFTPSPRYVIPASELRPMDELVNVLEASAKKEPLN